MKKLNVILVYNKNCDKILMCKRTKEPFKGMYNLVGGKLEENEDELVAAYRELEEETGITSKDINLSNLMNYEYKFENMKLEVFVGKLNKSIELQEEVNKLYWINIKENFFDSTKFAGQGNIGHMILRAEQYKNSWDI